MGLRSASPIDDRTRLFDGRRWRRSSRCWPATSSAPSNSPWASLVVMVRKKDGSLRFCVDFRQLNAATVKDAHPLPRIDDLLDALPGVRCSPHSTSRAGTSRCPSLKVIKQRQRFVPAVDSCTNLTRSPSVFATHLPPSLASWIASLPATTGRRACST